MAASIVADAVVIDVVAPTVLPGLVAALGAYTLLRPLFEHIPSSHGERHPELVGHPLDGPALLAGLGPDLEHHPDCPFPQLRGVPALRRGLLCR